MPVEQGYTARVAPASAPTPVLTSPAAMGAGIGQALGQLGDTLHATQIRAYQAEREQTAQTEAADFFHKFAQTRQQLDQAQRDLRANAAPGGAGHVQSVQTLLDKQADSLFSGITEQTVLDGARRQWESYSTGILNSEGDWAEGQRVAKVFTDTKGAIDIGANRVGTSDDPQAFRQEIEAAHARVQTLAVPPDRREELAKYADHTIASERIQYLNRTNPKMSLALIDGGAFNPFIAPQHLDSLRQGAEVEIRRQQAEIAHQQALEKAQLGQQVQLIEGQASQGQDIDVKEANALAQRAMALGDPVKAQSLQKIVSEQGFMHYYRAMTPLQRQGRMAELSAKKNPSALEQSELHWAQAHSSALDQRFNQDPVGYYASFGPQGTQPPAIDFSKPASLQARAQWRTAVSQTVGRDVPLFSDAEAAPLREAMAKSEAGRNQVLQYLDGFDPMSRADAAVQLAPHDPTFQHQALVAPFVRATLQRGREATKGNQNYWPNARSSNGDEAAAGQDMQTIDGRLAFALRRMSPAQISAVSQTGREWLAGLYAGQGRLNGHGVNEHDYSVAISVALGGRVKDGKQYGGVFTWGPQERAYVVPEDMTADDFAQAVIKHRQGQDKAGAGPVDLDGKPFDLKMAFPTMIAPRTYVWETSTGIVQTRGANGKPSGTPFVTKLERR